MKIMMSAAEAKTKAAANRSTDALMASRFEMSMDSFSAALEQAIEQGKKSFDFCACTISYGLMCEALDEAGYKYIVDCQATPDEFVPIQDEWAHIYYVLLIEEEELTKRDSTEERIFEELAREEEHKAELYSMLQEGLKGEAVPWDVDKFFEEQERD